MLWAILYKYYNNISKYLCVLCGIHLHFTNGVPFSPLQWRHMVAMAFELTDDLTATFSANNNQTYPVYHYPLVRRIFNHKFSLQMMSYTDSVSMPWRHHDTLTGHNWSDSGQRWWANQRRSETLRSCETSPALASISSAIFLLAAPLHPLWCRVGDWQPQETLKYHISILDRSRRCACLVIWFCSHLITKPGNKTGPPSWPGTKTQWFMSPAAFILQRLLFRYSVMISGIYNPYDDLAPTGEIYGRLYWGVSHGCIFGKKTRVSIWMKTE